MNRISIVFLMLHLTGLAANPGIESFDTGYTITKVRTASHHGSPIVVASTYEGTVLALDDKGRILWENPLSGFMNHDLWCSDLNGDGSDEILAANADGTLYCLDAQGVGKWDFKRNDAPMNAVCTINHNGINHVVAGGYDNHFYYISPTGELIKEIASNTYSKEKSWGKGPKRIPPKRIHTTNFLRPLHRPDGSEVLVVHGALNSNSGRGSVYFLHPLEDTAFKTIAIEHGGSVGELRVVDIDNDGHQEVLTGASTMIQDAAVLVIDPKTDESRPFFPSSLRRKVDHFGYRVAQPELISDDGNKRLFVLFGSKILLIPMDLDPSATEVLSCKYAFNDMWKDGNRIILASSQSGGSCIHVINTSNSNWKSAYEKLSPPGKIQEILDGSARIRKQLAGFTAPEWERAPLPVYLMTENTDSVADLVDSLSDQASPVFLNGKFLPRVEDWDRSEMPNEHYRKARDRRKKYVLSEDQMVDELRPNLKDGPGTAYWGGHGNDPYQVSLPAQKRIIDAADGKKVVMIYPELEAYDDNFEFCLKDLIYPLAEYSKGRNANIYIRTKHTFWQSIAYMPLWSRMLDGEFADVFVPSMEETTDKSMELSIAARSGIWASGAVNQWGARCARDNPSFNRLRQHSHQMLPNHFLRAMIYNISSGAQYINNFAVDQTYMSLLWELIAKGVLFVPKRSEIVSYSPVHLGMLPPDERYLDEGNNAKWTTFFDEATEKANPMVFSRLNGTWPGAPLTAWDFSRYAAGVKERRLNFLPPYENGLVLITPPQHGKFAAKETARGDMSRHLHPLYEGIMKEFLTDGRQYFSSDGKTTHHADSYYKTIEDEIKQSVSKLPVSVSGDVAWVAAQTSPTHIRLTLIDSGYINPSAKTAQIRFHTVEPIKVVDLLENEIFDVTSDSQVAIDIPCGLFRFIDIELSEPLGQ